MTMNRRDVLRMGALLAFAAALARAQKKHGVVITPAGTTMNEDSRPLVAKWFAEDGLVDGRDLVLEFVVLDEITDLAEIERRARAIVASRPDAILVSPHVDATLFKRLTRDVPIVFWALSGDAVRMGLVESLRRPGGNITGTSDRSIELMARSYQLFKELRPGLKRVGTLMDDGMTDDDRVLAREAQGPAAKRLGLQRVENLGPI